MFSSCSFLNCMFSLSASISCESLLVRCVDFSCEFSTVSKLCEQHDNAFVSFSLLIGNRRHNHYLYRFFSKVFLSLFFLLVISFFYTSYCSTFSYVSCLCRKLCVDHKVKLYYKTI